MVRFDFTFRMFVNSASGALQPGLAMLDKIPMWLAKWILLIPAAIALGAGMLMIAAVDIWRESSVKRHVHPDDMTLIWIGCGANAFVFGFAALLFSAASGKKFIGYSRGFWLALLMIAHTAGWIIAILIGPK